MFKSIKVKLEEICDRCIEVGLGKSAKWDCGRCPILLAEDIIKNYILLIKEKEKYNQAGF